MDVLSEIIKRKRERVEEAKRPFSPNGWKRDVRSDALEKRNLGLPHVGARHALRRALQNDGINIIAEFKRRSPSKGVIREDADLYSILSGYEAGGAVAVSVLTEEDYFGGSIHDLPRAKREVDLPVLRKDFVFDEYQVYESALHNADAILLIVAALEDEQLAKLRRLIEDELEMDALVEVHNDAEMERAARCGATIIGVNNRDLRTFEVSLETSMKLAPLAPRDALLVSESGLNNASDLRRLKERGFHGFLIGEFLMRAADPAAALRDLRNDIS